MDILDSMRAFVRIAQTGSFTKAATLASTTPPAMSRAIAGLEAHLRARLLHRTTRQVSLTPAGERYLQQCVQILECVDLAEAEAAGATAKPSGRLRVHCTTGLGQHYIAPMITHYHRQFPDVVIDLVLAQRVPDMIEEGLTYQLSWRLNSLTLRLWRSASEAHASFCARLPITSPEVAPLYRSSNCLTTLACNSFYRTHLKNNGFLMVQIGKLSGIFK